mmetsp:Transcript_44546/g.140547  ORF Transcript_44546/g.140547 Transcript_44546/m.140547 type:complete len:376 (+) Transcript_44546:258-1385(+)
MNMYKALLFFNVVLHGGLALVQNPKMETAESPSKPRCLRNNAVKYFLQTHRRQQSTSWALRGGLSGGLLSKSEKLSEQEDALLKNAKAQNEAELEGNWRPMCRICYEEDPEGLFAPCKCNGSMRFVHQECLRKWRAVKIGERGYTHCPMCDFQYRIRDEVKAPPDTFFYRYLRNLACSDCAILCTLLSFLVAIMGEFSEQTGFLHGILGSADSLAAKRLGKCKSTYQDAWYSLPMSPASVIPPPVEIILEHRLKQYWASFFFLCIYGFLSFVSLGPSAMQRLIEDYITFLSEEAEIRLCLASASVWWVVYTACEIVFVHLHEYPEALFYTVTLYAVECVFSIIAYFAIQLYVIQLEQPGTSDVLTFDGKTVDQKP